MFSFILLVVILFCQAFGEPSLQGRIVGGSDAKIGDIPYIVSIRGLNRHGCGGSILNKKFILTAAHCFNNYENRPELFSIQYGVTEISASSPTVVPVKKIIKHEGYVHSGEYPNDIALLELDGEIIFGQGTQPVKLPFPFQFPDDDSIAVLAGWGLNKSGGQIMVNLQKVDLNLFSDEVCADSDILYNSTIHICAGIRGGGKGQCTGDSGGPLVTDGLQYGIVSWSKKPCASSGHPGYYTKVTYYRNWIRKWSGV